MEHQFNHSSWRRGWNDTKKVWTSWQFYVLDAVVAVMIGGIFEWYWGLVVILFGMICAWLGATTSAPYKQRNEARLQVNKLKDIIKENEIKSNTLKLIMKVRDDGVNLINDGFTIGQTDELGKWKIQIGNWRNYAQSLIDSISPIDSGFFRTLGIFSAPNYKGISSEHSLELRMLYKRIDLIEGIAKRYL